MEIFVNGTQPSNPTTDAEKIAATLSFIDRSVQSGASALLSSYVSLRRLVYKNPWKLTPEQVYAALETRNAGDAAKLGRMAKVSKAAINDAQPGKIVDEVPAVTLGE